MGRQAAEPGHEGRGQHHVPVVGHHEVEGMSALGRMKDGVGLRDLVQLQQRLAQRALEGLRPCAEGHAAAGTHQQGVGEVRPQSPQGVAHGRLGDVGMQRGPADAGQAEARPEHRRRRVWLPRIPIVGVLLVLFIIFLPKGILGSLLDRLKGRPPSATPHDRSLDDLPTEAYDPAAADLDLRPTHALVEAMKTNQVQIGWLAPFAFVLAEEKAGAKVLLKSVRHGKPSQYSSIIVRDGIEAASAHPIPRSPLALD